MGSLLLFILLLPFILLVVLAIRYRRAVVAAYKMRERYKQAQRHAEAEREGRERVRKRTSPSQSSVEMIDNAALDLEGGEYVEYEEIEYKEDR